MNPQSGGGWIELICGSIFSGKTEELLRRVRRSEIARHRSCHEVPANPNTKALLEKLGTV